MQVCTHQAIPVLISTMDANGYCILCCMTQPASEPKLYDRIYDLVCAVPAGRVTTYGTIGMFAGCPARVVGYAMHHLRHTTHEVPWQRVINARGGISTHGNRQRELLEREGIIFEDDGVVDLTRWMWTPDPS